MPARRVPPPTGPVPLDHGTAELVRDLDVADGWLLYVNGAPSSYVNLDDPLQLDFEYVRWIGDLLDLLAPAGEALPTAHLGGAAGTLARYVAATRPRSQQVLVEYDAKLVELVRSCLGLPGAGRLRVRVTDARAAVRRLPAGSQAAVVRDAFEGLAVPPHLTSVEFVREVQRTLTAAGAYVLNTADRGPLRVARAEAATMLAVFPHVLLVAEPALLRGRRYGNLVLAGAHRPLPADALARRAARGAFPARVLGTAAVRDFTGTALPLTDATVVASPAGRGRSLLPGIALG